MSKINLRLLFSAIVVLLLEGVICYTVYANCVGELSWFPFAVFARSLYKRFIDTAEPTLVVVTVADYGNCSLLCIIYAVITGIAYHRQMYPTCIIFVCLIIIARLKADMFVITHELM